MRKKELKIVITFESTFDAMAMESYCTKNNIPGRLIPVPQVISAGCGMAWCADIDDEDIVNKAASDAKILYAVHKCMV